MVGPKEEVRSDFESLAQALRLDPGDNDMPRATFRGLLWPAGGGQIEAGRAGGRETGWGAAAGPTGRGEGEGQERGRRSI